MGPSRLSKATGHAAALIRAIVAAHPETHESWFYFERSGEQRAEFFEGLCRELDDRQQEKFGDVPVTTPFCWLEYPDGRRDAKGDDEAFSRWAAAAFKDKTAADADAAAAIAALTERPAGLRDLVYDLAPGSASPPPPEGATLHRRGAITSAIFYIASLDAHYRQVGGGEEQTQTGRDGRVRKSSSVWTAEDVSRYFMWASILLFGLSVYLWYTFEIPIPTEREAKRAAGMGLEADERDKQRRARRAARADDRLAAMLKKRAERAREAEEPQPKPRRRTRRIAVPKGEEGAEPEPETQTKTAEAKESKKSEATEPKKAGKQKEEPASSGGESDGSSGGDE